MDKIKESIESNLSYSLKKDFKSIFGYFIPLSICLVILCITIINRIWAGFFIFLPIFLLIGFVVFSYASRQVILDEKDIKFIGKYNFSRLISYSNVKKIEIVIGSKIRYLELQTYSPSVSIRIDLAPFSNGEWSKFLQVVFRKSPNVLLTSRAERWKRGVFY